MRPSRGAPFGSPGPRPPVGTGVPGLGAAGLGAGRGRKTMPHSCIRFWGRDAKTLTRQLDATTRAERRAAVQKGSLSLKRNPYHPYEGWVPRVKDRNDYRALVDLYFELCLALRQPTDMPNHFGSSAIGLPSKTVDARVMGNLARRILVNMERDGTDLERRRPVHHKLGFAQYGVPNWLEKPPEATGEVNPNKRILPVARSLLRALRAAVDC